MDKRRFAIWPYVISSPKDVSNKTNEKAGDGTTTASVLAQAIVHEGLKAIEQGANGVLMKDGINKATENVLEFINK